MQERLRIHQPAPTCPNPAAPVTLALLIAALLLLLAPPAHSQFIAFNDHYQGSGSSSNATYYVLNAGANSGPLKDITVGTFLPVILTITNNGCIASSTGTPFSSGPAYDTFQGYVDFTGYTINIPNVDAACGHLIAGLDPNCRYSIKGTGNRGVSSYTNRWAVFDLLGAESVRNVHSPGCLTNDRANGVILASNQVAICTGMNTYTGAIFDWEDVQPESNGQVVIISRKYTGVIPNGANDPNLIVFGIAGLRVEETYRPLVITNQPQGLISVPGKVFTFSVGVRGTGPLFYQWRKDGTNIPGATNSTYTISPTIISDSGTYSVAITNSGSFVVSSDAILTIGFYPPVISNPPHSVTQAVSAPFGFEVVATGAMPISYQWFKDSAAISGATNSTYEILSAKRSDAGSYFVMLSNELDVITSEAVVLTLTNGPVRIVVEPADQGVMQRGTASFTVGVIGTEPAFQWFKSDVLIPNATNATYSITNVQLSNSGWYSVRITNMLNTIFSRRAILAVAPSPISVISNAQVWKYNFGSDLGNTWGYRSYDDNLWPTGPGPLGFPGDEPMPSGSGLKIATVLPQIVPGPLNPLTYYFRTSFNLSRAQSGITLTVSNLIDDGAVFYLNGQELKRIRMPDGPINSQSTATASIEVSSQSWDVFTCFGEALCSGTNIASVEVHQVNTSSSDVALYSLWKLDYPAATLLVITNQPVSQTIPEQQPAALRVGVQGGAGEFQWYKMGPGGPVVIPGATDPILRFSAPLISIDDGTYYVVISNALNQVTSTPATLTITSSPPQILRQPAGIAVCEGDPVTFQIDAYGSPLVLYQWRFNNSDIQNATNASYFVSNVSLDQAGIYSVVLSNSYGWVESLSAVLQVSPQQPAIITQPENFVGCIGGSAYFTVEAVGCGLSYQWQFNGTNIPGQLRDPRVLVLGNLSPSQVGDYSVVVSNRFGCITSVVAQLSLTSTSMAEALNWNGWTNWGTTWFVQGSESHDGIAAVQAGGFAPGISILQTSLDGPGKISFWFKLWTYSALCQFSVDNINLFSTTGEIDWHREIFYLGPGTHLLEWTFSSYSSDPPYAWIDEVSYTTNVAPSLVSPLTDIVTAPGDKVVFRAIAEGMPPLRYQWQLNGLNVPGANQPSLTFNSAQMTNAGAYTFIVSNDYGATSATATLTLTNSSPLFHPQKSYMVAVPGRDCLLQANAYGSGPLFYQWQFQGSPISGETNDTLVIREVTPAQGGVYSLIVSNTFGISTTPGIQLIVHPVTHVIHLSMDGLGGKYLATGLQMEPERYPNFIKIVNEGSTTLNARCDYDNSVTVPNHICMITGRPVLQPAGKPITIPHGYTIDGTVPGTLHNNGNPAVPYKASVFDVTHDHGLTTAFIVGKSSLTICADSYNAVNGGPDIVPPDNGRKKIDYVLYTGTTGTTDTVDKLFASLSGSVPFNYYFLHFSDLDGFGHGGGWGSSMYFSALQAVDYQLGRILAAIETNSNPDIAFGTALMLTADHGGHGINHSQNILENIYTIPLFVWGPGFPANTDLYTLFANRADPGTNRLDYNALWQPLRNSDTGNLALSILGLPPIPGSYMQPLFANTPWLALSTQDGIPTLEWSAAVTGFTLETSDQIGPSATWLPITTNILLTNNRYTYPIPTFDPSTNSPHFYRLHK